MKKQINIHPAILVDSPAEFQNQIDIAKKYVDHVDVDIIDWKRTTSKTISVTEALGVVGNVKMNFDLMMDNPQPEIEKLLEDERVITIILNINQSDNLNKMIDDIKKSGKRVGVSLNPENEVEDIKEILNKIDHVQIFTIEPGSQGQAYISQMLDKVEQLRNFGFTGDIGIDGGVNEKTIKEIIIHPINYLSVGSLLSQTKKPNKIFKKLNKIIEKSNEK